MRTASGTGGGSGLFSGRNVVARRLRISTAAEPIGTHMQSVAFAEGESLTYLRGERDWIVVSGMKSDRIFIARPLSLVAAKSGITSHSNIPPIENELPLQ
jgi:hypothetical protein